MIPAANDAQRMIGLEEGEARLRSQMHSLPIDGHEIDIVARIDLDIDLAAIANHERARGQ